MLSLMAGTTTDTVTVAQAATLLGITPKRIRQLIGEGRLPTIAGTSPVALPTPAVLAERDAREAKAKRGGAKRPGITPAAQVVALDDVLALVRSGNSRAIEAAESSFAQALAARDRVEKLLQDELAATRAEVERLRRELDAKGRRGLFRR
jgi:hypothetical protein